jgi:hypothetical protein
MIDKLNELWGEIYSVVIALIRLLFLTCAMFTSGIHIILFTRTELCNVELRGQPWRCDREKLEDQMSFMEKTMLNNPELLDYADAHPDMPPPSDEDEDDGDMDI